MLLSGGYFNERSDPVKVGGSVTEGAERDMLGQGVSDTAARARAEGKEGS